MLCFLCFSQREVINFIKKTKIVWVLWLAERSVYMRVCKHGCDVTKMFCCSWVNHMSTNLKKFFSSKLNKFTLFTHSDPSLAETWKIFTNKLYQFFFLLSWHFKWEKSVFWKASFCNTRTDLILMQDFVYKTFTLQLVRISLLISAITKSFVCFLGKVILFLHSRGGKNSRQLCKPETFFVSGLYNCLKFSHHPSCLYQAMQTWKTFSIA